MGNHMGISQIRNLTHEIQIFTIKLRIALRSTRIGMTKEFLNTIKRNSMPQQPGSGVITQMMKPESRIYRINTLRPCPPFSTILKGSPPGPGKTHSELKYDGRSTNMA
jgi:hypothetical protein